MTMYNAIAKAAQDRGLKLRIAACFAQETTGVEQPLALADVHMWRLAAQWGPNTSSLSTAMLRTLVSARMSSPTK